MPKFTLHINGKTHRVKVDGDMPLLWVLRDVLGYTGTKYGCGRGLCGACTLHVDGDATRACMTAVDNVDGAEITTIEGLSTDNSHPVQKAWIAEETPQCGYCQPGQIMTAAALLDRNPNPDDETINSAMKMNLCRCGSYDRVRKAIHRVSKDQE
jgi:isoquinoline 1-oxidoreductase alpha subunit|tara:strand:- start:1991 stop:2452 length:462 start_codon:yes stop_codon:yes gene_type:complete